MKSTATVCRLLALILLVLSIAPLDALGEPATPEALRARKLAARRYQGLAVALPDSAFSNGLHVCARETPSGINGYWKVPPKVMDLIDADLMAHLRKSGIDKKLPFSAKLYVRQYAGFVRDGMRFVYVNALLVEKESLPPKRPRRNSRAPVIRSADPGESSTIPRPSNSRASPRDDPFGRQWVLRLPERIRIRLCVLCVLCVEDSETARHPIRSGH